MENHAHDTTEIPDLDALGHLSAVDKEHGQVLCAFTRHNILPFYSKEDEGKSVSSIAQRRNWIPLWLIVNSLEAHY